MNPCGTPNLTKFKTLVSLQRIVLSQRLYKLSKQSPTDALFKLLEQNIHTCPQLDSVIVAQCHSSWPRFVCQLRKRNREAMLHRETKCIEELGFSQPLHATIIKWLVGAINPRILNVIKPPPIREGNAWPMRPLDAGRVSRSCYICHITGIEPGCLEYETRNVDVVGSEVRARRYMQADIGVLLGLHREIDLGDYSYMNGRGGTTYASMSIWVSWVLGRRVKYTIPKPIPITRTLIFNSLFYVNLNRGSIKQLNGSRWKSGKTCNSSGTLCC
jgi:hypothetical protein